MQAHALTKRASWCFHHRNQETSTNAVYSNTKKNLNECLLVSQFNHVFMSHIHVIYYQVPCLYSVALSRNLLALPPGSPLKYKILSL